MTNSYRGRHIAAQQQMQSERVNRRNWQKQNWTWESQDDQRNPSGLETILQHSPTLANWYEGKLKKDIENQFFEAQRKELFGGERQYKIKDPGEEGLLEEQISQAKASQGIWNTLIRKYRTSQSDADELAGFKGAERYVKTQNRVNEIIKGFPQFKAEFFSSGITLQGPEGDIVLNGKVEDLKPSVYRQLLAETHARYYELTGIWGADGKEGLTTKFLRDTKFYDTVRNNIRSGAAAQASTYEANQAYIKEENMAMYLENNSKKIDWDYVLGGAGQFHDSKGDLLGNNHKAKHDWIDQFIKDTADVDDGLALEIIASMEEGTYTVNGKPVKFSPTRIATLREYAAKASEDNLSAAVLLKHAAERNGARNYLLGEWTLDQLKADAKEKGYSWRAAELRKNQAERGTVDGQRLVMEDNAENGVYPTQESLHDLPQELHARAKELMKTGKSYANRENNTAYKTGLETIRTNIGGGVAYLGDDRFEADEGDWTFYFAKKDYDMQLRMLLKNPNISMEDAAIAAAKLVNTHLEGFTNIEDVRNSRYYKQYEQNLDTTKMGVLQSTKGLIKNNASSINTSTTIDDIPDLGRLTTWPKNTKDEILLYASGGGKAPHELNELWKSYYWNSLFSNDPKKFKNKREFAKWLGREVYGMKQEGLKDLPEIPDRISSAITNVTVNPTPGALVAISLETNTLNNPWYTNSPETIAPYIKVRSA